MNKPIASIDAVNAVNYVENVLTLFEAGFIVLVASEVVKEADYFGLTIEKHVKPVPGGGWLERPYNPIDNDSVAQIMATSGTEGKPKAILVSHSNLTDTVARLNHIMNVDSSISEYVGVPVTHSFGFGRCRAVLAAGGRCYIPNKGFSPLELAQMLKRGEINAISAVPTLWRMILSNPDVIGELGKSVKWIEIGSQYMSREEKEKMKQLFPDARIIQHYGLTEASRSTFLEISSVSGEVLESVGKPFGSTAVSISAGGRICIKGDNVALGKLTETGEVEPISDEDGWLETSDQGRIREGFLYYEGRADDLINCGGLKVAPEQLEVSLRKAIPGLARFAICGVKDEARGEGFFVAIEKGAEVDTSEVSERLDKLLAEKGIHAATAIHVQFVDAIPVTHNGKVKRKQLAEQFVLDPRPSAAVTNASSIEEIFRQKLKLRRVDKNKSFVDLGGDSLNYVQMSMDIERHLGYLPDNWEGKTIAELGQLETKHNVSGSKSWWVRLDLGTGLRAFAITLVVLIHAGFYGFGGATIMLMLLIGYNFARFQSSAVQSGSVWSTVWSYSRKILLPFYLVVIVYTLWARDLELETFLLYSNWVYKSSNHLVPVWFVLNLLQVLVIFGVLFSLPTLRSWLFSDIFKNSIVVLAGATALQAGLFVFVHEFEYTMYLPYMYFPVFWLGWCLFFSDSLPKRGVVFLMALLLVPLNDNVGIQYLWLLFAALAFVISPPVWVPRVVGSIAVVVASATFYIFIFNQLFLELWRAVLGSGGRELQLLQFALTMVCCVLAWWVFEKFGLFGRLGKGWNKASGAESRSV